MSVEQCHINGAPGYRAGKNGVCYTFNVNSEEHRQKAYQKAAKDDMKNKAKEKINTANKTTATD